MNISLPNSISVTPQNNEDTILHDPIQHKTEEIEENNPPAAGPRSSHPRVKRKLSSTCTLEDLLDGWTQCQFFLKRKSRLCNVGRAPGSLYCGAHRPDNDVSGIRIVNGESFSNVHSKGLSKERINCPSDPSHTIFKANLASHLKICTTTTRDNSLMQRPYYKQGCNSGNSCVVLTTSSNELISVDPDNLLIKLKTVYDRIKLDIEEPMVLSTSHPFKENEKIIFENIVGSKTSFNGIRHVRQDIAIVEQMISRRFLESADFPNPPVGKDDSLKLNKTSESSNEGNENSLNKIVVEFGAGRGMLGLVVSCFCPNIPLVLVERSGVRKKADRSMRILSRKFERVRMDIRDCYIPGLVKLFEDCSAVRQTDANTVEITTAKNNDSPKVSLKRKRVIVTAKHLCGLASDLTLRGMSDLSNENISGYSVALATCCHHACHWEDYVGSTWFESQGFNNTEFKTLCQWSGWQSLRNTSSFRQPKVKIELNKTVDQSNDKIDFDQASEEGSLQDDEELMTAKMSSKEAIRPLNLSAQDMVDIGFMSKRLIDQGRLQYLRDLGYEASQVRFCSSELSPENVLIVANRDISIT